MLVKTVTDIRSQVVGRVKYYSKAMGAGMDHVTRNRVLMFVLLSKSAGLTVDSLDNFLELEVTKLVVLFTSKSFTLSYSLSVAASCDELVACK